MDFLEEIAEELAGRYQKKFLKKVEATMGAYTLTKRRKYVGVDCGTEEILLTQFDDITIYPDHHLATVNVNGRWALYDLCARQAVSPFQFREINIAEDLNLAMLTAESGLKALYNTAERRYIVHEPTYIEYDISDITAEYLPAKQLDGCWCFINNSDNSQIAHIYGIEMPYHTARGIFARVSSGQVCAFDHKGTARPELLRAEVLKHGGYLQLGNHSSNIYHYIDVYGNILNI